MPDSNLHPAPKTKAGLGHVALAIFCGSLFTLSGFTVDVMIPAFGAIARDLETTKSLAQATIPAFLVTFAFAQIVYGPFSDRFGRKPVILAGLTIYAAGALLAAIAPTIEGVLAGRAVQGFGAAVGPVVGRAILRDVYSGQELARTLALSMMIFSIGPIIAPLVGFGIEAVSHWRFIFGVMLALSGGLLLLVAFAFHETNSTPNSNALSFAALVSGFSALLIHRQSRLFLIFATAAYSALMSYIVNSSRVLETSFGIVGLEFAVLFGASGLGIIVGQAMNRRALPALGIIVTMRIAASVLFLSVALIWALNAAGILNGWTMMFMMFVFNTSFLVIMSNSLALAIDPHPKQAGSVSSFFGFVTTITGAASVAATTDWFAGDVGKWSMGMSLLTGITLMGLLLVKQNSLTFEEPSKRSA